MPVLGVGGIFFPAQDPETLGAWYREHLGVGVGAGHAAPGTGAPEEWTSPRPAEGRWDQRDRQGGVGLTGDWTLRQDPRPRRQPDRAVGGANRRGTLSAQHRRPI